ncbi:hypothetical protein [Kineobactrum salinum]|uniref:SRPBCC family protein n=1 Tax=Kineobactrum salinum TaxID=2708301 RepID=A0A6C0U506_9GAMM|nr:hypothetical protein [Kineobactrum salinum]QIB67008.1 hypothetical protein G3T16_18045 [Kineobactrum salinum]
MIEQITLEIQAEAVGKIAARREEIWQAVAELARRPNLKSYEPLFAVWPDECAQVRTVMDKGMGEMIRTETVIRCVPEERFLLKIEAPEWGSSAWLDHRIERAEGGWYLTIGVIAIATYPEGAGPKSRDEYAAMTQEGLEAAVDEYRKVLEAKAPGLCDGETSREGRL